MRARNTDTESTSYQERSTAIPIQATGPIATDDLEHLTKTLAQMQDMISQSLTALVRIEQRLSNSRPKQSPNEPLSTREIQVLKLAAKSRTNLQLANLLAQRIIAAAQTAQMRAWTPEDARLVLCWLTPYPAPPHATLEAAARAVALIRELGGPIAARQRLDRIAHTWQARYPLHSAILRQFLAGCERKEIVRHLVRQGWYEDSRVYTCIKELPDRISEQLRRAQSSDTAQASLD